MIRKQVDDGDGQIDRGQSFVYDGSNVVLVFDNTGAWQHRYLHGDAVDQVFLEESVGEILWGLADNQGTVRDIANYDPPNDASSVLNHRQFDSFGNIIAESNGNIEFRYAYTGRYFDEDTGLQYNRRRWYDAGVGRWISEDPLGFGAGDANINRYVGNGPTNFTDPSGMDPPGGGPGGSDTVTMTAAPPPPGYDDYVSTQAKKQPKGKPGVAQISDTGHVHIEPMDIRDSLPAQIAPKKNDPMLFTPQIPIDAVFGIPLKADLVPFIIFDANDPKKMTPGLELWWKGPGKTKVYLNFGAQIDKNGKPTWVPGGGLKF